MAFRAVVITTKGRNFNFVIQYFTPKYGINENPVTLQDNFQNKMVKLDVNNLN